MIIGDALCVCGVVWGGGGVGPGGWSYQISVVKKTPKLNV